VEKGTVPVCSAATANGDSPRRFGTVCGEGDSPRHPHPCPLPSKEREKCARGQSATVLRAASPWPDCHPPLALSRRKAVKRCPRAAAALKWIRLGFPELFAHFSAAAIALPRSDLRSFSAIRRCHSHAPSGNVEPIRIPSAEKGTGTFCSADSAEGASPRRCSREGDGPRALTLALSQRAREYVAAASGDSPLFVPRTPQPGTVPSDGHSKMSQSSKLGG